MIFTSAAMVITKAKLVEEETHQAAQRQQKLQQEGERVLYNAPV